MKFGVLGFYNTGNNCRVSPPNCSILPLTISWIYESLPVWNPKMLRSFHFSLPLPSNRFFCKCSGHHDLTAEMSKYKEAFAQRMAMAGLKPHHRIALGVSGGPDSTALCVLTAEWKTDAQIGKDERNGCINGLLAIIVDHGLRQESKDESHSVKKSVSEMGIRCEIASCNWINGRPKLGHLEEAARDKRYQIFQNVCIKNQIGVLLIAHHADDQAELFILRLSRNSGVLGLAGMAFTSQLFPTHVHYYGESSSSHGILLVRPLLDFSKADLYKICQRGKQKSVEDPTNRDERFARNAIRSSLRKFSSCIFRSEMQAIILACRKSRLFVDKICCDLINQTVTVTSLGYAIIDLEKLNPLNVDDICLSKFIALVLQFISQRHRPVRGRTSKLLLDYIRNYPCKTSLTAAACYLSAAPRSNGTKILICCSPDSPQPLKMELSHRYFCEEKKQCSISEIEQILMVGKSYSNGLVPDATNVYFLHTVSTDSLLSEAKRLKILSESTHRSILVLQTEAIEKFNNKTEVTSNKETKHEISSTNIPPSEEALRSGQCYHFINRFLVMWRFHMATDDIHKLEEIDSKWNSDPASADYLCNSCVVGSDAIVRYMIESDWLYLASLSKGQTSELCQEYKILSTGKNQRMDKKPSCSDYIKLSAQRALRALKSIPVSARRGLPVLVNSEGLLLSIPNIYFNHCPYLSVSAVFKPRVPLGGGHSSFI